MNPSSIDAILRLMVCVFVVKSVAFPLLGPEAMALTPLVNVLTLVGFNAIHAVRRYGAGSSLVFLALTCVISWGYETCSILTGFPFGHYHYSDLLGLKLWLVPVLIMPAYFAMGYLSWTLAHVLLARFDDRLERRHVFLVPVIASFVMVMWDLGIDPARATIEGAWVWHDGGPYFGVPLENFSGWYLCVFTVFQCFALYHRRRSASVETASPLRPTRWTLPVYLYASTILDGLVAALRNESVQVQSRDGHVWWTGDIHASLALVSIFTMLFVSVLALVLIHERREPAEGARD